MSHYYSEKTDFFHNNNPQQLLKEYGSPLYVYNENIFRKRCREMKSLIKYPNFKVTYSIKANSNLTLLRIAHEEGLHADAVSPGEMFVLLKAGFLPEEIFYISNNVSEEEMKYAVQRGIITSIDSISQLRQFGRLFSGEKVAIRINPGVGAGHHEKVVTGGKNTKFGINIDKMDEVKKVLKEFNLSLVGINQHIGSLFMDWQAYLLGVEAILDHSKQFDNLEFIDFGGGFGVPYRKQEGQERLVFEGFGEKLNDLLTSWANEYGKNILFRVEPGRYISAEAGILLGNVHAVKNNCETKFVGTDIGQNVLIRPAMYDSYHEIEIYRNGKLVTEGDKEEVTIVGNICESGDILGKNRSLHVINEGDILGVMDAGAYGYSMASNYNSRLRPAEILIRKDGFVKLIRKRDTLESLIENMEV